MQRKLSLFIFVDALGWEVLSRYPEFLAGLDIARKPLKTIFGYSSACDPSIISGKRPADHGLWSSYFLNPEGSPFGPYRWLQLLPRALTDRARVRHHLSKWMKKRLGYTGYFQLYHTPFEVLPYFDYAEKWSIWKPGGMAPTQTIFDHLHQAGKAYFVDDAGLGDKYQWQEAFHAVRLGEVEMAYVLLGELDAVMHQHGTKHREVTRVMHHIDDRIRCLYQLACDRYEEVALYVFSDHGMHDVKDTYDLQRQVGRVGLQYGRDYLAFYDSTMARFWFLHDRAGKLIEEHLAGLGVGRFVHPEELHSMGVLFPDQRYGDSIYLMNPGTLIVPSYMGVKAIPGMHGYHPDDPDSVAAILSNRSLPKSLTSIEQIYQIMCQECGVTPETVRQMMGVGL